MQQQVWIIVAIVAGVLVLFFSRPSAPRYAVLPMTEGMYIVNTDTGVVERWCIHRRCQTMPKQ